MLYKQAAKLVHNCMILSILNAFEGGKNECGLIRLTNLFNAFPIIIEIKSKRLP